MMNSKNIFDFYVNQELKEIKTILHEWCNCFIDFSDISKTVPHQSKPEETNVGILSGAAWKCDWVVFQEMSRRKNDLKKDYGYCDIWMKNKEFNSFEYYLECKGGFVETKNHANNILNDAITDTRRLITENDKAIKLAIAFCNIQFHKNSYDSDQDNKIKNMVKSLIAIPNKNFYAYCFPNSVRNYCDGDYYYPGVLILGHRVI